MSGFSSITSLSFSLLTPPTTRFGPRIGQVLLRRDEQNEINIQTPNFITSTSRGVIPHLSRDHYGSSNIRWVNVPFESFLDVLPPVPTLANGRYPFHAFLGYSLAQHVVSMTARDPADEREMPPNGNTHVSTYSLRGVRKLTSTEWKSYVYSCKPDVVFALTDTPFTQPPYSQKRLTKSIERSASWLANIISPPAGGDYKPNVLVHMAGVTSVPARRAFAESLVERLFGPDAETIKPLKTLDEGVFGYIFDLVPIRLSLDAAEKKHQDPFHPPVESIPLTPTGAQTSTLTPPSEVNLDLVIPSHTDQLSPLLRASLEPLPTTKLRLVNTVQTPHEILRLISSIGIDIFDAHWAQRAADIGVALDFTFPAQPSPPPSHNNLKLRNTGRLDIGRNLYDSSYVQDFSAFGSTPCTCHACAPIAPSTRIYHGADDPSYTNEHEPSSPPQTEVRTKPGFTRAYVHHLLHTHEMSAHALLVMHNLAILDRFFAGIREFIRSDPSSEDWDIEVTRFEEVYDEGLKVFEEARVMWRDVDLARGKGRLAREKAKQEESTLGTAIEM